MKDINKKIDILFLIFIIEIFVVTSFVILGFKENSIKSYMLFGMVFLVITISFYTNIVIAMILSSAIVFIHGSYIIYNGIRGNTYQLISIENFIWLLIFPIVAITASKLGSSIQKIQIEKRDLEKEMDNMVCFDYVTSLYNKNEFYRNLSEEMKRAQRHKFELCVIFFEIQYFNELNSVYGKNKVNEILAELGDIFLQVTRQEDKRYRLDENLLAAIMPNTNMQGAEIVKERLRDKLDKITITTSKGTEKLKFHFKIAIKAYDKSIESAFQFKHLVEKELEYDV